ncbi:MAG: transposase [Acutalibacteraceae bacterium]
MIGKVSRKTLRLQNFDYSSNGKYFITICTYGKGYFFGEIVNGVINLSVLGKIAEEEIHNVNLKRAHQYIEIEKYVVMPNHIHMIISIYKPDLFHEYQKEKFSVPTSESISAVVRSYKSAVSKRVHEISDGTNIPYTVWQPRYYDNVIKNEEAYRKICEYIETNPLRWKEDRFYNL